MNVRLMHPDRDWAEEPALTDRFRTYRPTPAPTVSRQQEIVSQDLALPALLGASAADDEFLFDAVRRALFSAMSNDIDTIRYRQDILADCLAHRAIVRDLYALAVRTVEERRLYISDYTRHPDSILYSAIEAMEWYLDQLRRLRVLVDPQTVPFRSSGFTALAAMLQEECSDAYLESVDIQLKALRFPNGTLLSAALGEGNGITGYRLHHSRSETRRWLPWFFSNDTDGYRFSIHERDEAGARELGEIRDRAINSVSNVLAQSSLHILGFFEILRAELAFYIGCLNLHDRLTSRGLPTCRPRPEPAASRTLQFEGLYDVCLAVQVQGAIVGNTLDAGGKTLLVITGANQGGKSTFLRSIGLAQIMMQCGMFVGAEAFAAELCTGVFTHYRREEDASMQHGKLDEELARASDIIDLIKPNALVLLNESFASTNAIEGAEIARQFVVPMVDARIKVLFVTHLYEFARRLFERSRPEVLFLRAERRSDGSRTFRVTPGEPLETSHGRDLYREVFGD